MTRRVFLDPAREAALRHDGYVVADLLTGSEAGRLLGVYARFGQQHAEDFTTSVLADDVAARRVIHDEVGGLLQQKLRPLLDDYRVAVGSYAVKQPNSRFGKVGLHQDFTVVDERDQVGLSVWCPLVDVGPENGWLGVMAGSHLFNCNHRDPCFLPYHDLRDVIEREYLTYLPLRAGQAVIMDNRLFHGSPDNHSATIRVVAAAIAVPCESQLLYCHRERGNDALLEVYEVPPDFYLRHTISSRPLEGRRVATVPRCVAELTPEILHSRFTRASAEARLINSRP